MRKAIKKSPIPTSHAFVVKTLHDQHFDPNWHFHPEYQLFFVLKGAGTRFVGDHIQPFREGNLVFTGPNLPHLWRNDDIYFQGHSHLETEGIVIYFHDNFLSDFFLDKEEMTSIKQLFIQAKRGLDIYGATNRKISKMMKELTRLHAFEGVIQLLQILHLLSVSKEFHLIASPGYNNSFKESETERISEVHAYVMKNFRNKISLEAVASIANMTPTSFSRFFKSRANKTFFSFLSEIRIGYACKQLIDENKNVAEACYDSGFATISNFNKQFKEITGKSPLEYKKEYRMIMYG